MFSYELKKITNKRRISLFLIFVIICLYYLVSGIIEYNGFLNDKNNFREYEDLRFQRFQNYGNYGNAGFHVMLAPNPLVIFFNNRQLIPTKCNIDTSEIIDVDNPRKGRSLFSDRGFFKGFAGFCTFFGILFYFYLGLTGFKSIKCIQFYKERKFLWGATGTRLLVLNMLFLLLFIIAFCIPLLFGIKFSAHEIKIYSLFVLYTLAMLSAFYLSGKAISIHHIKNNRKLLKMTMVILLIVFILIPEILIIVVAGKSKQIQSVDKINITKFSKLADFEKKSRKIILEKIKEKNADPLKIKREHMERYIKGPYQENEELENQIFLETKDVISFEEISSILIPPVFHSYLLDEAPGTGYYGYVGFFDYIMVLRFDFMKFYIDKRQFKQVEKVECFVKDSENIYNSSAFLPVGYYWALGMTLLYSVILIFISDRKLRRCLDEGGKQFIEGTFEFNKRIRELLDTINEEEGRTIVYLGSEMYDTVGIQEQEQQISEYSQYKIFKIEDINHIVL